MRCQPLNRTSKSTTFHLWNKKIVIYMVIVLRALSILTVVRFGLKKVKSK